MRAAVISDIHVLGPGEIWRAHRITRDVGVHHAFLARQWHRALMRARRRLWNWHPEKRYACFVRALDTIGRFTPDWVVANGDFGGDASGVGISADEAFESVRRVVNLLRCTFPGRCRFVYGDHEIGKHSTELGRGGIRLESVRRGEEELEMPLFWHERDAPFHLIGVSSTLLTLRLFLPEARPEEIPEWEELRRRHVGQIREAFASLPAEARVLLFVHDPSALGTLEELPEVRARLSQIERTIVGHLHAPALMPLARLLARLPAPNPRYPVARIIAHGTRSALRWPAFRPVVCPSTFGAGGHVPGGVLFIETNADGRLVVRRQKIIC
jgi:hypothetical protein